MPVLTDIVTAVTDFVSDYAVFITAGMVLGLAGFLLRKLVKSGR